MPPVSASIWSTKTVVEGGGVFRVRRRGREHTCRVSSSIVVFFFFFCFLLMVLTGLRVRNRKEKLSIFRKSPTSVALERVVTYPPTYVLWKMPSLVAQDFFWINLSGPPRRPVSRIVTHKMQVQIKIYTLWALARLHPPTGNAQVTCAPGKCPRAARRADHSTGAQQQRTVARRRRKGTKNLGPLARA